jgi:polyisoprenoid-binding protein YceI
MSARTGEQTGLHRRDVEPAASIAAFDARSFHGPVHGTVPVLSGSVTVDDVGRPVAVNAELDLAGLSTGNARRDKDLRGQRFFDTASRPTMTFEADTVMELDDGWDVTGVLDISRTRCPLTLHVARDSSSPNAFTATVSLDARDLGVKAPRFFVRKLVTLTIKTHLRPQPGSN